MFIVVVLKWKHKHPSTNVSTKNLVCQNNDIQPQKEMKH